MVYATGRDYNAATRATADVYHRFVGTRDMPADTVAIAVVYSQRLTRLIDQIHRSVISTIW